jgi:DNA polymerase III subunit beta
MFKIQSEMLRGIVSSLAKGARKVKSGELLIFIRTQEEEVSFYFNGEEISVEKKAKVDIQAALEVATSVKELSTKVSALPSDEEILCQLEGNLLKLKWGKKSEINVEIIPETSPLIEIPSMVEKVKWGAGVLHGVNRVMPMFSANSNSAKAKTNPCVSGPNFEKDQHTGEIFVRATDSFKAVTIRGSKIDWFNEPFSIDSNTLGAVADVLPEDAEITVGLNEKKSLIVFQSGSTTAVSRIIEGKFPSIDKSYFDDADSKWRIDRLDLVDLCRRVRILSPQMPIVQFRFKSGKVHAVIPKVLDQQIGVCVEGKQIEFAANATYLEMTAQLYRCEEILLLVNGSDRPITVKQEGLDHTKALVLPTRLMN